jgi:hypothetical protein
MRLHSPGRAQLVPLTTPGSGAGPIQFEAACSDSETLANTES